MIKIENTRVENTKFGDIYFNDLDPLGESEFLYSSAIDRLKKDKIVVAELGFGAGVNFALSCKKALFANKQLFYFSVEKFPLKKEEIQKIASNFNSLKLYFDEILKHYPPNLEGLHRIELFGGKVILGLYFGDVKDALCEMKFKADLWYLDGFNPSKNPDMWSDEVFFAISHLCGENAILRSFSCSRIVKDNLAKNGFEVLILKGFGKKRNMLEARISKVQNLGEIWFNPPKIKPFKDVLIIGSGIAGLALAYKFASNFNVTIAEKENFAGANGSSNLSGLLMPLITQKGVVLGQMHLASFLQAMEFYRNLGSKFVHFCEILEEIESLQKAQNYNDGEIFSLQDDFIKINGAQIEPKELCLELASKFDIKFGYKFLYNDQDCAYFENGKKLKFDLIIFATGSDSRSLFEKNFPDKCMQLSSVRGQTTHIKPLIYGSPVSSKGYFCAPLKGVQVIGSTYDRNDDFAFPRGADDEKNLRDLFEFFEKYHPNLSKKSAEILGANVGFRSYSGDRFPIIGALHDSEYFCTEYKNILWTKNKTDHKMPKHHQNCLISAAHGSRGLGTAILGANILYDLSLENPIFVTKSILNSLNPARFLIRKLKKGLIKV